MKTNNTTEKIKRLTAVAVFAALAYVAHFIHIPVMFLNLDFKDVIMTVCGMYFGPAYGGVVAVLVPLLEYPTSSTGVYGLIMNILSSTSFVCVASLIYKYKKTLMGAIVALCSAVLSMVAVMMVANLFITPYYMGVSRAEIVAYIPTLLLPFNAVKAVLNASLTLCVYKPLARILKRTGFVRAERGGEVTLEEPKKPSVWRNVAVVSVGAVIAAISLIIIFKVLGGSIEFN